MTLSELLESRFRGDIRFRGAAYLEADRVAITRVTGDRLFAVVRDGDEFQTQLCRQDNELQMHCTCSGIPNKDVACKHLWATVLATDKGGYVTGSAKRGYVPPFVVESEPFAFDMDDWEDDDSYAVFNSPKSKNTEKKLQAKPRLRPWEERLQRFRQEMDNSDLNIDSGSREREIYYEIDQADSRTNRIVVVEVSQRQRRSNGQWGKIKPLKLRLDRLDEVEHEDDRRIVSYLFGGSAEQSNWHAQQSQVYTAVHRFRLSYDLSEMLLPMMAKTGRLRFLGSDKALEWDDSLPWEMSIQLAKDSDDQVWRLIGRLSRDGEELLLTDTELVVPGGLAFAGNRISRLRDYGAHDWIDLVLGENSLTVPLGEEAELVDQLLDLPSVPRLQLPEELQLEEVKPDLIPRLVIHSPKGSRWKNERLRGEVFFEYLGTLVRARNVQTAIVQRDQGRCLLRDRAREEQAWSQLLSNGFRRLLDRRRGNHDVDVAARDLGPAVRTLIAAGWDVRAEGKKVHQPGKMHFHVKSNIDWFELHAEVDFGGRSVEFPQLLSALARGDTTIRLDDGSLGILPEEWMQQYGMLAGLGVAEEDHLRFANSQIALLDALLATQESVDVDERFAELREKLWSFDGVQAIDEPEGFEGTLRTYQKEGIGWLAFLQEFRFGGCLADDMGLGKTVQMLALLLKRKSAAKRTQRTSLIVVPKSLLFNWQQETKRFTPDLSVLEYMGLERATLRSEFDKFDIVLTTYGTLRRDVVDLRTFYFDYIVLDEAQTIKNSNSQVAKAARLLKANFRVALSGTPVENHLGDLWSIFEFLNPGMLGRSSVFKRFVSDPEDHKSRDLLSRGLRAFILRRTKKQVASDLPEKTEQTIFCDMEEKQHKLYQEMRDHYRDSLLGLIEEQGLAKSKMHVLEALLRLRQAACHPGLLDESRVDESSAKLDVLCPYLEELVDEGHKALVFSQFTSMLAIVKKHLDKRGIKYEYLDGQTRNRQAVVENFQTNSEYRVFLISLKAGGLGLNLTAADYVFILDPWWNPAVETQAIDRAHRVGQTRRVIAYRLICRNTVEEKIASLQDRKRVLADAILQENTSIIKKLTADELKLLLS